MTLYYGEAESACFTHRKGGFVIVYYHICYFSAENSGSFSDSFCKTVIVFRGNSRLIFMENSGGNAF